MVGSVPVVIKCKPSPFLPFQEHQHVTLVKRRMGRQEGYVCNFAILGGCLFESQPSAP